jgi:molybdopterin synthase sulfur carrier subunit
VKVCIRLFAVAKDIAGCDSLWLDLPDGATVAQLRERLAAEMPALAAVLPQVLFAVGNDYARDDTVLSERSEVACIPPVSGG